MTKEEAIRRLKEAKGTIQPFQYVNEAIDYVVKALEQEPCENCVSRDWLKIAIHNFYQGLKHIPTEEDIQAYIDVAPSVTPQSKWVACSERLPKNDEVVLGTNSSNDLFKTYTWDDCGEIKWYADGCLDVPVIAWMPLPEPYKEDEEK